MSSPLSEKYFSSVLQKCMIVSAHPASTGGAYRDRHGRWKRGAVDVKLFSGREPADEDIFTDGRNRVVLIPRCWDEVLRDVSQGDGG
jgi:hypothetical protein